MIGRKRKKKGFFFFQIRVPPDTSGSKRVEFFSGIDINQVSEQDIFF